MATTVKGHSRSVKGKGNTSVKRHSRVGRASSMRSKGVFGNEYMGALHRKLADTPAGLRHKVASDAYYGKAEREENHSGRRMTKRYAAPSAKQHTKNVDAAIKRAKASVKKKTGSGSTTRKRVA